MVSARVGRPPHCPASLFATSASWAAASAGGHKAKKTRAEGGLSELFGRRSADTFHQHDGLRFDGFLAP